MKRVLAVLTTTMMTLGIVSAAWAAAPLPNLYESLTATILEGRQATAWPGGNGRYDVGNVIQAASYNGALGTEWTISCPVMAAVNVTYDGVDGNGIGIRIVQIDYVGGVMTLDGAGAWGNGDAEYYGVIDSYTEIRTLTYVFNNVTGTNEVHSITGHFQGYDSESCFTFDSNGAWVGDGGGKPGDYPDHVDSNCTTGPTSGRWGTITDIALNITGCAVPVQERSWGQVKKMYND